MPLQTTEDPIILKIKPLFLLLLFIFFKLEASSFDRFYLTANSGAVLFGNFTAENQQPDLQINDLGRSWIYGGGIGFLLNKDFRLEIKATSRPSMRYQYFSESIETIDLTVGKLKNSTITLGVYYHLFHLNGSTPYLGLGCGYSRNTLFDNQQLTDLDVGRATPLNTISSNNFCFFASTGVLIDLASQWKIDIACSYINLGQIGPIVANRGKLHNIAVFECTLGLLFKFP